MTTGTKVFLAVFALFVGVMVLYYGVFMPSGAEVAPPELAKTDTSAAPSVNSQLAGKRPEQKPVPQLHAATPTPVTPEVAGSPAVFHSAGIAEVEQANSLPVGLDPTRMLPLVTVDDLPAVEQDQVEPTAKTEMVVDPATQQAPASPGPAPQVRPNMPVSLDQKDTGRSGNTKTIESQPKLAGTPSRANAAAPKTTQYIVKSGDTMMTIAKTWFGDETKWSLIAKANPWVDPARMQIGQKLQLPAKDSQPESIKAEATPEKTDKSDKSIYIVRSGDTLAKIAREFYGNIAKWELIYQANKAVIGEDPAALQVGMKLTLPKSKA